MGTRDWRWNVAVLWVAVFLAMVGMSLVMPFLPLYLRDLHVPESQLRLWAGWVGGANFLCAALFAPLWGSLADRYGRKPMALRALVGLAVCVGTMGFVQNVYQLFFLRALQGMFGGFLAAAISLAAGTVPRDRIGGVLGLLQSAVVGGNLLGPLVGGELSHHFQFRATFRITGVALLLAMVLVLLFVREERQPDSHGPKRGPAPGYRELLALPAVRLTVLAVLLSHCGTMLVNPQIALLVRDLAPTGDVERLAGLVSAAPAVGSLVMAAVWGRIGDRWGHAAVLGTAMLGAGLAAPWAAAVGAVWQLFLVRLTMGLFTSAVNPAGNSTIAHSVDERRNASAFALLASGQMLGNCVGPFLGGPLATAIGVRLLFPITGVLLVAGSIAALAVFRLHVRSREDARPVEG